MLSFLYVYSDHSILECYNLFSGVELSMRSFFVIIIIEGTTQSDHRLITVQTTLQLDKPKGSTTPEENNIFKRLNFYQADWDALNQKLSSIA